MGSFFVPYMGNHPALVSIKGHKLLILARDRDLFFEHLPIVGADRLKRVRGGRTKKDEEKVLAEIAEAVDAGVIVASSDIGLDDVLKSLQANLPWVQ